MATDIVIGFDSLALVVAIGLTLTRGVLVPVTGFAWDDRVEIDRTVMRLLALCIGALWLTSLAWLWTRTAAMSGRAGWAALPMVPIVLWHSHFGLVWWLRAGALLWTTFALVFLLHRQRINGVAIVVLLFGLAWVAASRSASGHAAANGDWTLREAMDWLHLLAISTWGGSLIATLILIFPRLWHVPIAQRARFATRFSVLATGALAVILISGMYSAWHLLPSVTAFWSSHYGRLLGLKLLFVAAMVVFGALNHYRLVPQLRLAAAEQGSGGVRRLGFSVLLESVLLLVVLAITALLLGSMPPMA